MNKPFLLKPSGKDYLWGGNRINDDFGKDINLSPLAESWECSVHEDGPSIVASGEYEGKSLKEVLESNPLLLGKKHKQLLWITPQNGTNSFILKLDNYQK